MKPVLTFLTILFFCGCTTNIKTNDEYVKEAIYHYCLKGCVQSRMQRHKPFAHMPEFFEIVTEVKYPTCESLCIKGVD